MKAKTKKSIQPKSSGKTKLLVYIDDGEYSGVALRFACTKATRSKRQVEMLYVLEPMDLVGLTGVEDVMRKERREKAEKVLKKLAFEANAFAGLTPSLIIREGLPQEQILAVLNDDQDIGALVLGESAGVKDGNKMISWLVTHARGKLRAPIIIVPGSLTEQQIIALA